MTYLYTGLEARFNEYDTLELMFDIGVKPKSPDGTLIGAFDEPILDVGCGRHALFVKHLRLSGLKTEGIDPEILDELLKENYLMKGKANAIPRKDNYYSTAFSHMSLFQGGMLFSAFNFPFIKDGDRVEAYKEMYRRDIKPELMTTLGEITRVLRPNGTFIIHPLPALWIMDVDKELKERGYRFTVQDVPFKKLPPRMEEAGFEYTKRLILKMPE